MSFFAKDVVQILGKVFLTFLAEKRKINFVLY